MPSDRKELHMEYLMIEIKPKGWARMPYGRPYVLVNEIVSFLEQVGCIEVGEVIEYFEGKGYRTDFISEVLDQLIMEPSSPIVYDEDTAEVSLCDDYFA